MKVIAWPARKNVQSNPYQYLLYEAIENESRVEVAEFSVSELVRAKSSDILHIHWPDSFLLAGTGARFWIRLGLLRSLALYCRARGVPIVWTVHNLRRNDTGADRLDQFFWDWFLSRVDAVIYLTHSAARHAQQTEPHLSNKRSVVIKHGHYQDVVGPQSRSRAKSSVPQVLAFGKITLYKRFSNLVEAFGELPAGALELKVAGRLSRVDPDPMFASAVEALSAAHQEHFEYTNNCLSDEELEHEIAASDIIVLPYSNVLNSGAAIYGLSAGCPILVPDTGPFRELGQLVGEPWVSYFEDPLTGKDLLSSSISARSMRINDSLPDLSSLAWGGLAKQTTEFFTAVAREPGQSTESYA